MNFTNRAPKPFTFFIMKEGNLCSIRPETNNDYLNKIVRVNGRVWCINGKWCDSSGIDCFKLYIFINDSYCKRAALLTQYQFRPIRPRIIIVSMFYTSVTMWSAKGIVAIKQLLVNDTEDLSISLHV